MTNKYVLIGIPNSGKTAIGTLAAKKLGVPFYETKTIAQERLDLDYSDPLSFIIGFQKIMGEHTKVLFELAEKEGPAIIEAWPESVMKPEEFEAIERIGEIILIRRDTETAVAANAGKKKGPNKVVMRNGHTGEDIDFGSECVRLYAKECGANLEAAADFTLDNDGSIEEAAEKLVTIIMEQEQDCE